MESRLHHLKPVQIELLIHFVRGQRVMLDSDLASLYGVSTKHLVQQLDAEQERREIGFHIKEEARKHGTRNGVH